MTYQFNTIKLINLLKEAQAGSSLRELTEQMGHTVSPSTLSRMLNGHIPDMNTFLALCHYLNSSPSQFFMANNDNPPVPGEAIRQAIVAAEGLSEADRACLLHVIKLIKPTG